MPQQDYINVIVAIGTVVGAIGGIPQILRWFGNHPKLSVDTVNIWYNPIPNSATTYIYAEKDRIHVVPARIWLTFRVANGKTRLRWLRSPDATGIVAIASIHNTRTGERVHNFVHSEGENILAADTYLVASENIPVGLEGPEYRVVATVRCKEGSSARANVVVPVRRVVTLEK